MEQKTRLHIGGMTCVSCQHRIQKALKSTEGVYTTEVSYADGTADVTYDPQRITLAQIISVIEALDYQVILRKKPIRSLLRLSITLVCIAALFVLLQTFGVLNYLVPNQLADTQMGYGILFVIGLLTSVHCIAMCGGINLSQCIPQEGAKTAFLPSLSYNLGRVLSYTVMGFVLGSVGWLMGGGTEVGMSLPVQGILKLIAGLFMVIMGINLLGLFPALRKFTVRLPESLSHRVDGQRAKTFRPFLVGILNGFMPCGPLQSMWIVALATESPFVGALSMLLFSLGTVPLMLGLGSMVSALGKRFAEQVMAVGGVLVVVLGLAMLSQGGSLSGWIAPELLTVLVIALCIGGILAGIPVKQKLPKHLLRTAAAVIVVGSGILWSLGLWTQTDPSEVHVRMEDGIQVVTTTLQPGSYPDLTVQSGIPVRWEINASEGSINGCNNRILIQPLSIEYSFHYGQNIIEFTPDAPSTIPYSCWMGMIHGNIFVTDKTPS